MKEFLDHKLQTHSKLSAPGSRKKGIGVVGLHEGRTLLKALGRTSLATPTAACDLDAETTARISAEFPGLLCTTRYEEMLTRTDVDLVAIYTPDSLHGKHITQAFDAGTPYSPSGEEGLETFCVMEAIRRSAVSGKPERIDELMRQIGLT